MIGMEWKSPEGIRKVVGQIPDGRYLVKYITGPLSQSNSAQIFTKDDILFEKKKDEHNFGYREQVKAEEKRLKAEYRKEHEVLLRYLESLDKTAMQKKRIENTLKRNMVVNGKLAPRWKHIVALVEEGYRVRGKELQSPDGTFFFQKDLTKIAFDFAKWLERNLGGSGLRGFGRTEKPGHWYVVKAKYDPKMNAIRETRIKTFWGKNAADKALNYLNKHSNLPLYIYPAFVAEQYNPDMFIVKTNAYYNELRKVID